jgi:hypothetical protein
MRLRRKPVVVLTDLSRPRVGELSTRPVASGVHVSSQRRVGLGALGFTPGHVRAPRTAVTAGEHDPRGKDPQ